MQLFSSITSSNEFEVSTISGGIYTKLITSITGLVIGLAAYLGYSYLNTQIDKASNKMEAASADFLDILQEPTRETLRMKFRKKHKGEGGEVFTDSLNDILFILLMFFLIVATIANPNVVKVGLPRGTKDTKAKQNIKVSTHKDQ